MKITMNNGKVFTNVYGLYAIGGFIETEDGERIRINIEAIESITEK